MDTKSDTTITETGLPAMHPNALSIDAHSTLSLSATGCALAYVISVLATIIFYIPDVPFAFSSFFLRDLCRVHKYNLRSDAVW